MKPEEIRNKRILISPLNWGYGHVARAIGQIHELIQQGNTVIVACDDHQKSIFLEYFPQIEFIQHRPYPFNFRGKGRFISDIMRSLPKLLQRYFDEKKEVNEYVERLRIDVIISDHRYGFRSKNVESIFLTHQLNLPVRFKLSIVNPIHHLLIKKFNRIWVLDFSNSKLAGDLSVNKNKLNVEYIGPRSRFQYFTPKNNGSLEVVVIISGPHEYAQQFYDEQKTRYCNLPSVQFILPKSIQKIDEDKNARHSWIDNDVLIRSANKIVSRSGYSTIMDLYFLKTKAVLIPTPGQREQIYLAELYSQKRSESRNIV